MSNSSNIVIRKDAGDEWLIAIMNDPEPGTETENGNSQHERLIIPMNRMDRKSVYCSYMVGIGPYYKGSAWRLDGLKTAMMRQFVQESGTEIEVLYNRVAEVAMAIDARKYYDEENFPGGLSDEELINILFLDGCFIVQFIFSYLRRPENLKSITMADAFWVKGDLLKLQNQLPFQVLQSLMSFRFKEGQGEEMINDFMDDVQALPRQVSLMQQITNSFCNYIQLPQRAQSRLIRNQEIEDDQPAHLLELLQRRLIGKNHVRIDSPQRTRVWFPNHSAKDLRKRGIHFRPGRTDAVTDMKFKSTIFGGILKLPRINIDNFSVGLHYNLVKYEMEYDASKKLRVTSYLSFLDSLIQDVEDVNILQSAGILINNLGSDQQIVDHFDKLQTGMLCDPRAYNDVKWQIESHYRQLTKKWIAEWLQVYFNNPWTFIAFVAAAAALTLTAIQTYLTAFPPKK